MTKSELIDLGCFLGVFLLAVFCCWLLSLAYPDGLVTEETITYWLLHKGVHWSQSAPLDWATRPDSRAMIASGFQWFGFNQLDWYRTIPYAALLGAFSHFHNPTNALYWLNGIIFSLNCALVFILGRLVFASRITALALSISALAFEVCSMHIFYSNLQSCADPICAEIIYFAVLIAFIAWIRRWYLLFIFSFATFGLAAFLKPVGICLWAVWFPFAVLWLWNQPGKPTKKLVLIITCFAVLVGPLTLWCLRNYCIYGYARTSGVAGSSFLQTVLPILTDDERLFDDHHINADFHIAVRSSEQYCKGSMNTEEKENASIARTFRYERYYLYSGAPINPLAILAHVTDPNWHEFGFQELLSLQPKHMFRTDAEAGRVAWLIISHHPLDYLNVVLQEYSDMYQPQLLGSNPLICYQSDPIKAYDFWDSEHQGERPKYLGLYPNGGFPSGAGSNPDVAKFLGDINDHPLVRLLLDGYFACAFWLSHLIFIVVVFTVIRSWRLKEQFVKQGSIAQISIILMMLFLTTASNNLMVSLCQIAKFRYQLAGEMELHLFCLISIFVGLHFLASTIYRLYADKVRDLWQHKIPALQAKLSTLVAYVRSLNAGQINLACSLSVFTLSIFCCWLLSLAYPQGLVTEETRDYWLLQKNFHWFDTNQFDWYRTIPYGLLLRSSTFFPNPTIALYWFNSLIFSLESVLVFSLGKLLFKSWRNALALAVSMVLFEVASMRTFYNNLAITTDALFGELFLLGALLVLIGWLKGHRALIFSGYAIFGLTAFLKPSGLCLWLVWIPFAFYLFRQKHGLVKQKVLGFLICMLLITGPVGIWSLRNYCIYGYAKTCALGGCLPLQSVLPLLFSKGQFIAENEILIDDPRLNSNFLHAVKQCKECCEKNSMLSDEKENANLRTAFEFERWFLYGPAPVNPFSVLARMTAPQWTRTGFVDLTDLWPHHMFRMDAQAQCVAMRIIVHHPASYVLKVLRTYINMYSPLDMWVNPFYSFQPDPKIAYNYWDKRQGPRLKYPELYPGNDFPSGDRSNASVAKILGYFGDNFLVKSFLTIYYACELWISHLIFIAAVWLIIETKRNPGFFAHPQNLQRTSLVLLLLFLTAASNYLTVALVHTARFRFQLSGDMTLHLLFLIVVVQSLPLVWQEIEAWAHSSPILAKIARYLRMRRSSGSGFSSPTDPPV